MTGRVVDGRARLMRGYSTDPVVREVSKEGGESAGAVAAADEDDDPLMLL